MLVLHHNGLNRMYSDEDGILAVRIARTVVECHVNKQKAPEFEVPGIFKKNSGVFVTLTTHPGDELRG